MTEYSKLALLCHKRFCQPKIVLLLFVCTLFVCMSVSVISFCFACEPASVSLCHSLFLIVSFGVCVCVCLCVCVCVCAFVSACTMPVERKVVYDFYMISMRCLKQMWLHFLSKQNLTVMPIPSRREPCSIQGKQLVWFFTLDNILVSLSNWSSTVVWLQETPTHYP